MLILTLWLAVVLTILATSVTSRMIMQTRLMSMRRHRVVAEGLARAGLAKAIADLKNDLVLDFTEEPQPFDGEGDVWKRPEEEKQDVKYGRGTYDVQVVDEESKININSATPQLLSALLQEIGYEEEDAKLAAAAIADWRDGDDQSSIDGTAEMRENEIYAILYQGADPQDKFARNKDGIQVRVKNDLFLTVDELLSVYGITPEVFFGPGSPEAEAMMAKYPDRWAYAKIHGKRFQIKKSHNRFRDRDALPVGLRDCVTVYSDGSINANTASLEVLSALIRASGVNAADPETMAARIIEYRRDGREDDITNNKAFRTPADINAVGAGIGGGPANLTLPVVVRSNTFTITSTGRTQRFSRTIQLVVRRNWEQYVRGDGFEDFERDRETGRHYGLSPGRSTERELKSGDLGPDERTVLWPAVRGVQWIEN